MYIITICYALVTFCI